MLAPLVVLIFWMGLLPQPFLKYTKASVEHFIANKDAYHLSVLEPAPDAANLTASAMADHAEKK